MNNPSELTCDQLHQQAMNLANLAVNAQKAKQTQQALHYFAEAFRAEKQADMTLAFDFSKEPSRSVLFRSAAFLALQAEQYEEAERMAAFGLIGHPPEEIAIELREALSQILPHFQVAA